MKRRRLSTAAALLAGAVLCLSAAGASADASSPAPDDEEVSDDEEPSDQYIDVLGSYLLPDTGRNSRAQGYGGSLIYGRHLFGPLWGEGRLHVITFETGTTAGADFYQYGGGVDLVGAYGDRSGFTPFALVGIGGVYDEVRPAKDSGFHFRADAGLGLLSPAFTSHGIKLRAEARALFDVMDNLQIDGQFSLGISIPLGKPRVIERVRVTEKIVVQEMRVAETLPDSDGDGIPDRFDRCPDTLPRARVNSAGCIVAGQKIVLSNIHFEFDSATLTLPSRELLDGIGASLRSQGDIYFTVAGHTDSRGSHAYNQRLSFARAHSVRRYLTSIGLRESHMRARGYGETKPIDTNATSAGRERNRRVEFHIEAGAPQ